MGLISSVLLPTNTAKGFDAIRGKQDYNIVYDNNQNVICWYYKMSGVGKQIIETYYKHNDMALNETDIETKFLSNKSEEVQNMLQKKIVVLDKKLVTYDVVVELAKTQTITGYTEGKLKANLNKFEIK